MRGLAYNQAEANCCFCLPQKNNIIFEDAFSYVYIDQFPVSPGHSLIIPKRHVESFFDANIQEVESIWNLLKVRKDLILMNDKTVSGFNIGINVGRAAGQSIFHLHVHLIPRRDGDIKNPKGGVRGVIPNKMQY